ncbi:MAG: tetratricopeptide repeat protein [Bacteroidales bacterium]|nr:tetratricopeptide repeat protein [Bacteroidales bacterium]
MKVVIICLLFVSINSAISSQTVTKTDSLKKVLKLAANKAKVFNELSREELNGSPKEALRYALMALSESQKTNDIMQKGDAYWYIARSYQMLNDYDKCNEYADSAVLVFQKTKNRDSEINCQVLKASTLMLQGKYNESLELFEQTAEKAKKTDAKHVYASILINMGRIHRTRGNFVSALNHFEKSLKIAEEINHVFLMGNAYYFIGATYQDQQNYDVAIENFLLALSIYEKNNFNIQIPYLLISLGSAYQESKNYTEALNHFQEALGYHIASDDRWGLKELYGNIGNVYFELNNLDSAWVYHQKSLDISKEIKDMSGECSALNSLGEVLIQQKKYKTALTYFNSALELNSKVENKFKLAIILYNLGRCYANLDNTDKGLELLHESLHLADSLNVKYERMILNKEISIIYSGLKKFEKALAYYEVYSGLNDSIYKEESHRHFVNMEQKYQSEKQKQEISNLKINNIEQEIIIRKQRSVRNFSILGFIFSVITGLLFYRSYLLKKRANNEKEALLKEIHHRVKNNLQIISSLLSIQSEYDADEKVIGAFLESQSRVKAMALIHQLLYQAENLTKVNFGEYLKQLVSNLSAVFQKPGTSIQTIIHADGYKFDIETSIPLGLIVTELVSNAYKYAFTGKTTGEINISLYPESDKVFLMSVADNGTGLPDGKNPDDFNTLGLRLVKILTGQLDGKFSYKYNHGAVFNVEFTESL